MNDSASGGQMPSPSPGPSSAPPTPSYRAAVSEDSDDYEHHSKPQGASTSALISHNTDSEGLRERNRTPYSVTSPSIVPKREDVLLGSPTPDQPPSSSTSTDKGKQRAEDKPEVSEEETNNDNPFACHIWCVLVLLIRPMQKEVD